MIDVAEAAGVSRMAVSAVLMGTGEGQIRVSPETAERIRQAATKLGYRPNPAARQLAGKSSGIIAIIGRNWGNFLAQRTLAWLHEVAEKQGARILSARANDSLMPLLEILQDMQSNWIDGVVYLAYENEHQWPEVGRLLAGNPRAVTAIGNISAPDVNAVVSDVAPGATATIEHLVSRGRRRLVFVTETLSPPAIQERIVAYTAAARAAGIQFCAENVVVETEGWIVSDPAHYERFDGLVRRLLDDFKCDAVICDTDFTASALIGAFHRAGVRVPTDISITGWGDLQFAGIFPPRLTTVSLQLQSLLGRVAERLRTASSTETPSRELVPTQLIVRDSA